MTKPFRAYPELISPAAYSSLLLQIYPRRLTIGKRGKLGCSRETRWDAGLYLRRYCGVQHIDFLRTMDAGPPLNASSPVTAQVHGCVLSRYSTCTNAKEMRTTLPARQRRPYHAAIIKVRGVKSRDTTIGESHWYVLCSHSRALYT